MSSWLLLKDLLGFCTWFSVQRLSIEFPFSHLHAPENTRLRAQIAATAKAPSARF
jgi:hypothetical protein